MLQTGIDAPQFEGATDGEGTFKLMDYRGKKNVVLYFYPRDFTPGCTREACNFRDNYADVEQYDAVIVGVSTDSADSHSRFRERHELPFPLVADPEKRIVRQYDADGLLGLMTARVTYVIDKQGVIRAALRHQFQVDKHLPEVLDALRAIEPAKAGS